MDYSVDYCDNIISETGEFPPNKDTSSIDYDKNWKIDSPILTCGYYWEGGKEHTITDLQATLKAKTSETPAPATTGKNDFEKAASWAKSKGLISGSYNGDKACTRAEAMTYLWKLAGSPKAATESYKPLIISKNGYVVSFDAAIAKKTTITTVDYYGNEEGRKPVTVLVVRPDTKVTLSGAYGDNAEIYYNIFYDSITEPFEVAYRYHPENGKFVAEPPTSPPAMCAGTVKDVWPTEYYPLTDLLVLASVSDSETRYCLIIDNSTEALAAASVSVPSSSFSDVPASASYAQAVAWAVAQGITSGTSKTTFSPNTACTRGQIVTFLYRAMGK